MLLKLNAPGEYAFAFPNLVSYKSFLFQAIKDGGCIAARGEDASIVAIVISDLRTAPVQCRYMSSRLQSLWKGVAIVRINGERWHERNAKRLAAAKAMQLDCMFEECSFVAMLYSSMPNHD